MNEEARERMVQDLRDLAKVKREAADHIDLLAGRLDSGELTAEQLVSECDERGVLQDVLPNPEQL